MLAPATPVARGRIRARPSPQALVAAESENRLVLVNLRRGRVIRSVSLPADPEYVAATRRVVVAASGYAGTRHRSTSPSPAPPPM
ncbi:MAG: hypothetical protein M3065_04725 [Actinomycetota bacterium]|nr:hypothetical protein [Actinomycetota bacterium]